MAAYLSDEQIRFFRDNGYLTPLRAIDAQEATDCRHRLEAFEADIGQSASEALHMKSHIFFMWLWRVAQSPAITGALKDLVGPDVLVMASRFWIKEPGDGKFVTWHQDDTYFGIDPPEMVTLWLAFTDVTVEAGCMRFLPGSHKAGARRHEETRDPDNLLSRGQIVPGIDDSSAVDVVLGPGEFSIHDGRMLHDSAPNRSPSRRIGLSLMVLPPHVRSTMGRRSATLLCGEDRHGNWDPDPIPEIDRDPRVWELMHRANTLYRSER